MIKRSDLNRKHIVLSERKTLTYNNSNPKRIKLALFYSKNASAMLAFSMCF